MKSKLFTSLSKVSLVVSDFEMNISEFALTILHLTLCTTDGWTLLYGIGSGLGNVVEEDDNLRILEGVATDGPSFTKVSMTPAKFYGK